jgi:hypothetical protein
MADRIGLYTLYFYIYSLELCYKTYLFLKTSHLLVLTKISYVSQEMERQVAEITPETCGVICHWMEKAHLKLEVPPTNVTYRAEKVPAVTGRMVLCRAPSFLTRTFRGSRERSATTPHSPSRPRWTLPAIRHWAAFSLSTTPPSSLECSNFYPGLLAPSTTREWSPFTRADPGRH